MCLTFGRGIAIRFHLESFLFGRVRPTPIFFLVFLVSLVATRSLSGCWALWNIIISDTWDAF